MRNAYITSKCRSKWISGMVLSALVFSWPLSSQAWQAQTQPQSQTQPQAEAQPQAQTQPPPQPQAQTDTSRKVKSNPQPVYPDLARHLRITGVARVQVTVGPDGTVKDVKELGGNPVLVEALSKAVWKWKYELGDRASVFEVRCMFKL